MDSDLTNSMAYGPMPDVTKPGDWVAEVRRDGWGRYTTTLRCGMVSYGPWITIGWQRLVMWRSKRILDAYRWTLVRDRARDEQVVIID